MTTIRLIDLPLGDSGTSRTVSEMRQVVRGGLRDLLVLDYAKQLALDCVPRDMKCRALRIRHWMMEHFQFEKDPVGVELLMTPRLMLDRVVARGVVQGDCDDAATLSATLGMAVGLPARFVLFGFRGEAGPFAHVFSELRVGNRWIQQDVTRPERAKPASRVRFVEV